MSLRFSPSAEKEIDKIVDGYPKPEAALLPALWVAQREFGCLSQDVRRLVAEKLGLALARVESVVSFYTMYDTTPAGKHRVDVCRNISCSLRGCDRLIETVEEELKIHSGETTPDGLFSYSRVECLAACGGAPAVQVDGRIRENVTPENLKNLLVELSAARLQAKGKQVDRK